MVDHMILACTVQNVERTGSTEHLLAEDSLLVTLFLNDIGERTSYSVRILNALDLKDRRGLICS